LYGRPDGESISSQVGLVITADGKTVYVTTVDDMANAPWKDKVYAVANE
jgi:hypothetical protein